MPVLPSYRKQSIDLLCNLLWLVFIWGQHCHLMGQPDHHPHYHLYHHHFSASYLDKHLSCILAKVGCFLRLTTNHFCIYLLNFFQTSLTLSEIVSDKITPCFFRSFFTQVIVNHKLSACTRPSIVLHSS